MSSNATEDTGWTAARSEAPGRLLCETREAQNLSVADVARQLKLSVHQVEALEAGDFQRLPGPVFVRGFVRNYARLLKLDAEPLVSSVVASLPREEPRSAAPPSQEIPFPTAAPRRWRGYAAALVAIVAALAAYEFLPGGPETAVTHPVAVSPPPAAQTPPSEAQQGNPLASESAPLVPPPSHQPDPQAGTAGAADGAQGASLAAAQGAARDDDTAPGPGERQVRMVFDAESWVEIRDRSGRSIFSRLNRPGTEQRVNGRPPLAVIVGNAHGVRLTYDERPVNLALHTKVDVARLTLE